jgi:uncharacterized protein
MTIPVLLADSVVQSLVLLPVAAVLGWRSPPRRWSLVMLALGFIALNQIATGHTELHSFIAGTTWNWQGKIAALAISLLAIALLLRTGWSREEFGLTTRQRPGSLRATSTVVVVLVALQTAITLRVGGPAPWNGEALAFQATMPTLAEELMVRGLLLAVLNRAFTQRRMVLGAACGWAVPLTALSFALSHGLSLGRESLAAANLLQGWTVSFSAGGFGRTLVTGLVYAWLRERSGSLVMPMAMHSLLNVGGTVGRMVIGA